MNTEPHTHLVTVDDGSAGFYSIRYGDTSRLIVSWPILRRWRLRRGIRRTIRKHDRGSQVKSRAKNREELGTVVADEFRPLAPDQWATEQLARR